MDFARAEAKGLFRDCLREKGTLPASNRAANAALPDFGAIDTDGDGRISAAEHAAAAKKMFQAMDQNRDGRVSAAEMGAAQKAISGLQRQRLSSADKIRAVDPDGDGVLTTAEHEAASRTMFARMDANRDGFLTKEEWSAGHAALAKK
jgi:Ca2+-binding EF-hand superfamily protein